METPKKIGNYTVIRELGRGGMGTVYSAQDSKGTLLAVKVLDLVARQNEAFERAFFIEYQIIAQLSQSCPYIVQPLAFAYDARLGRYYFVMEHLGGTLRNWMSQRGKFTMGETQQVIKQIGRALQVSHARGVVHRDVKPENILFRSTGEAVLSDFGISKVANAVGLMTRFGKPIGTPIYMAPEQIQGSRQLDGKADVYSLATVAYEMLMGKPPFPMPPFEHSGVMHAQVHTSPPPLPSATLKVPTKFTKAIMRGLEKPLDKRPTAAQFLADISGKNNTIVKQSSSLWIWLLLVMMLISIIMIGVVIWGDALSSTDNPITAGVPAIAVAATATFNDTRCTKMTMLPTRQSLIFAAGNPNDVQLFSYAPNGDVCQLTAGAQINSGPTAASDGQSILFAQEQTGITRIIRLEINTRHMTALATLPESYSPNWRSNSDQFVFDAKVSGVSQVYLGSIIGGTPIALTRGSTRNSEPTWSPNASQIAFASNRDSSSDIYVMNPDGSNLRRITQEQTFGGHATWSPDARRIAYECGFGDDKEICVIGLDRSGRRRLTNNRQPDTHPAWSPDGNWIVAVRQRINRSAYDLVLIAPDGNTEQIIELGKPIVNTPAWMP